MAWGGERGVVVVDTARRALLAAHAPAQLYAPPAPPRAPDAQRSPSLDQLEETCSRPTPAASPSDLAPEEPAPEPAPPASPAPPAHATPPDDKAKLDTRRKSTSWKHFNLKRQLSKVDLKFKAAFATPTENNLEEVAGEKSNSQFYCESAERPDKVDKGEKSEQAEKTEKVEKGEPAGDSAESPCSSEHKPPDAEEERAGSPGELFERMHRELQERRGADVYARMHRELQERWQEQDAPPRPDCLALDEPPRPARRVRAGDARLLSVPNIKYRERRAAPAPGSLGGLMRRFSRVDKLDSSFSRSRSSSMSSLENISQEGIQCLAFADSYTKKSDPTALMPTLWIGTTLGSVLTMTITLPEPELRHTQPVLIATSGGPLFRLKGSILTMSFLDCNGALIPYSYESWRDDTKDAKDRRERTPTKQSSSGSASRMSPTPGADAAGDRQFVVVASEKQARVVALPSQNCVYRQQIVDTDFVVKAETVSLKDSVCLVNYLSTGHLVAYSLPSLRPLVDVDFLPLTELGIAKTFCFSNRGHGLYLASPTEIQKFTIDAEFCQQLNEMIGELFLPRDMPEPPKESFFRGLFGGGARPLDREELFGESSGKPLRTVAKHIPGGSAAQLEQLGARAGSAAADVARAHQLVVERGDKLSQLEDRTERMHNQAAEFSSSAHQLMLKYKDKKWYQL